MAHFGTETCAIAAVCSGRGLADALVAGLKALEWHAWKATPWSIRPRLRVMGVLNDQRCAEAYLRGGQQRQAAKPAPASQQGLWQCRS